MSTPCPRPCIDAYGCGGIGTPNAKPTTVTGDGRLPRSVCSSFRSAICTCLYASNAAPAPVVDARGRNGVFPREPDFQLGWRPSLAPVIPRSFGTLLRPPLPSPRHHRSLSCHCLYHSVEKYLSITRQYAPTSAPSRSCWPRSAEKDEGIFQRKRRSVDVAESLRQPIILPQINNSHSTQSLPTGKP